MTKINLKKIDWLFLDVDGVLTDGKLIYTQNGEEVKIFSVYDGHGIKMIKSCGVKVGVISGRGCKALEIRLQELGIDEIILNRNDKGTVLDELINKYGGDILNSAHIGDDLPDLEIFERVSISISVHNAMHQVKNAADLVLEKSGGDGAVREFCDMYYDFFHS